MIFFLLQQCIFLYRAVYIDRVRKLSVIFPPLLSTVSVQSRTWAEEGILSILIRESLWFLYRGILDRGEKIVIDIRLSVVSVQRRKDWSVLIRLSLQRVGRGEKIVDLNHVVSVAFVQSFYLGRR